MNICVLYYDGFCEFEVVVALEQFRKQNIISVALEDRIYISEERQRFLPDKTIQELNPTDIDLFLIPGGDPSYLFENEALREFIQSLNEQKKYIAGICGGTDLMAKYGILDNRKCTGSGSGIEREGESYHLYNNANILMADVVVDRNVITSTGQAFIELAIELGKLLKLYDSEEEARDCYKWYKNIKEGVKIYVD